MAGGERTVTAAVPHFRARQRRPASRRRCAGPFSIRSVLARFDSVPRIFSRRQWSGYWRESPDRLDGACCQTFGTERRMSFVIAAPRKPRASSQRKEPSSKKPRQPVPIKRQRDRRHRPRPASLPVSFGPEICADLAAAEQREWLVTNGIGGFASGTIAGSATRRYHGLFFAALSPPSARTLLVGGVDEVIRISDQTLELGTHRWLSGAVAPAGYRSLRGFRLEGTVPTWTYQAGAAQLEKSIWMEHGENTTYVRYGLAESPSPVELDLKVLVNYRDFHGSTHSGSPPNDWRMNVEPVEHGARVVAFGSATPFYLRSLAASCEPRHVWYRDFLYLLERERGLDDHEDQLFAVQFRAQLKPNQSITLVFSTSETASMDGEYALA